MLGFGSFCDTVKCMRSFLPKPLIFVGILVLLFGAAFFARESPLQPARETPSQTFEPAMLTKEELLLGVKEAVEAEDYALFAQYLKTAQEKGWYEEADFQAVESAAYVKADETYFIPGDYEKTLEVSTLVYDAVPEGWRFRYLRILALEKLGRLALEKNDLKGAEEYALTILRMSFRLEGTNLLADVYIQKIEKSLASGNKIEAQEALNYIWDFEVSEDRRAQLEKYR